MGLIKEPKNVDFFVIDKPWSEEELKEFSNLIRSYDKKNVKKEAKPIKSKNKMKKENYLV